MKESSRRLAQSWPFPRHQTFVRLLRSSAAKWFSDHDFATLPKKPYCLNKWENWPQNIILPEVADFIASLKSKCKAEGKPFPLHKFFHHGLSSQALLFNLIGPLFVCHDLEPLADAIVKEGIRLPTGSIRAKFEYEDRAVFNEDTGQPTSVDLVINDVMNQPKLFIEAKLIEEEFGGCSVFTAGDCGGRNPISDLSMCYLHHIGRKYWDVLKKHGFFRMLEPERQCALSCHYQFFREFALSLEKNGIFILMSDERSPVFHCHHGNSHRGLMPFLLGYVPSALKRRVASISIQSVVESIEKSGRHGWISEFKKKYGLD
jgi:hypothetical protein